MESDKMESESATRSLESIETSDFGVLLRSYRCRSPPIWVDFDSDVSDDEDFNKLLKNLRAVRRAQSSGFCVFWDYTYRSPPSRSDFSSSEKKHVVADDEDWVKSPDDQMATGSLESNDSGVSLKSDRSKGGGIDFKDRVSPRPDFSSSEEEDVSDDEDWVKSPDDLPEDDILPYIYPWSDDCDWMELADNLWWDFDSDVSVVEDFNRLQDNQARHEPGAVV